MPFLVVEVLTNGKWLPVNKREIKTGMSEKESAAIIEEIATLKMQWETSGVFGNSHIRVNMVKMESEHAGS